MALPSKQLPVFLRIDEDTLVRATPQTMPGYKPVPAPAPVPPKPPTPPPPPPAPPQAPTPPKAPTPPLPPSPPQADAPPQPDPTCAVKITNPDEEERLMQEAAAAAAKAADELYQKAVASADWEAQMRRHFGSPCESCRTRGAPCREHAPPPKDRPAKDRWTKHYAEMFKDNTPWWTKGVPADYGLQELQGPGSAASSSPRDNSAAAAGSSAVESGSESMIEQRPGRRGVTTLREM